MVIHHCIKVFLGTWLALLLIPVAQAAPMLVSGGGMWDSYTTASDMTAAETAFSFSFTIDSELAGSPTNMFSDFSYLLGGNVVSTQPTLVTFYTGAAGGGFALDFAGNDILAGFGPSMLDADGHLSAATAQSLDFSTNVGASRGTLSISPAAPGPAVPEPATWALMMIGFAAIGTTLRGTNRRKTALALAG